MRGPDRKMIRIARKLRVNQTDAEAVLWNRIRNRQISGHKFVRQEPIGNYICDFVCRERLVVIEVDGGQHNESAKDVIRDRRLAARLSLNLAALFAGRGRNSREAGISGEGQGTVPSRIQ